MPTIRRTLKNVVKNYSDAQVKVREATSNDPWGPSSTLMSEIADLTYNVVAFTEIMQMVWKRLNDDGKNWRHVYKSLMVLDYIIKTGSEKVAQQCKENFHAIKTLTSFQYIDADNKDQGMNVREKAKQLVALFSDDERLKNERMKALKAKERFAQSAMGIGNSEKTRYNAESPTLLPGSSGGYSEQYSGGATGYDDISPTSSGSRRMSTELEQARPSSVGEEELQLQLALAMSKEEHDEDLRKQKSDDIKLQMALDESRKHADDDPPPLARGPHDPPPLTRDPWGAPLSARAAASPPLVDPWASPSASRPTPPAQQDPWGAPTVSPVRSTTQSMSTPGSQPDPWSVSPVPQTSPWTSPAPPQQQAVTLDAFGLPVANNTSNGTNNIDEAFDLLSSRSNEDSSAQQGSTYAVQAFDPLAEQSDSDLRLDGAKNGQPEKKKSPHDFLGQHTGLVNLDELVSQPKPKGKNPFAIPAASNPFEQPVTRVPMNQMQNTNPGFTQAVSSGLLPTPLLPVNSTQPQPQGYNPFL